MSKLNNSIFDKNFAEIASSEIILIFGGIISGVLLAFASDELLLISGILIILPGFLEMRGNISGAFAARLASGLFLKVIKPDDFRSKIVKENILASFILAMGISIILGLILFFFNWIFTNQFLLKLIFIPFLAGVISNAVEIPLALIATFYLFKNGHDPNNIMGPFITITGDVVSIISLLIAFIIII